MNAVFLRSPSGISLSSTTPAFLSTGTDSPVSEASSILRFTLCTRRRSAGTKFPASSSTMSPPTRSRLATTVWCPSRMTAAFGADIFFSAASACSAFDSWITPTTAFRATMNMMAIESTYSPRASETSAAITRMMTR